MTDEEVAEYNRLLDRYNSLVAENRRLAAELETGIENCYVVGNNIDSVGQGVTRNVNYVADETHVADGVVEALHACLKEITEHYALFKNLSEASKMLTKYNDEYYTKYKFYNELRRITLGYVIGIDAHIVSSEALRKKVEKAYLANTDYWLAYAISAVMLWASNEKEAANRALSKSLSMDCYKSCVFFMLVNIRFNRLDVAREWYLTLLEKTDVNNMSDEWQHVLHAYLIGAMSRDKEFTDLADSHFDTMLEQTEATNADFNKRITERARTFADRFIHLTEKEFLTLKETCAEYGEMKNLLSSMEKISVMAQHYDEVYAMEDNSSAHLVEQIEDILYNLINAYDENEYKIVKNIKYNEMVMAAEGDTVLARKRYDDLYGEEGPRTFADLMTDWAFSEDYRKTNISIKRFALSHLKDRISKGILSHFEERRETEPEQFRLSLASGGGIAPCCVTCGVGGYDQAAKEVREHYNKNKRSYIFSDKLFKIFIVMCLGSLALLGIGALVDSATVMSVMLVLGVVLGVVSGFLVWRRWVDLGKEIAEFCRLSLVKLQKSLEEIAEWKKLVAQGYTAMEDLKNSIDKF